MSAMQNSNMKRRKRSSLECDMAGSSKRAVDSIMPDRISFLPDNIKDLILSRMPIRDAVRTSILARNWRHCWHRMGDLVFDEQFVNYAVMLGRKEDVTWAKQFDYSNIITAILMVHLGPIRKFLVHIPKRLVTVCPYFYFNNWMLCLSRSGVKHLTIYAWASLPSSIFSCQLLKHLKLSGVHFGDTPPSFEGFPCLNSLDLSNVNIGGDALISLISFCPLLDTLSLDSCLGCDLEICLPGLRNFFIRETTWGKPLININLKHSPYLRTISLNVPLQATDVTGFFTLMPLVEKTTFDGNLVTSLTAAEVPTRLPVTLAHHRSLTIFSMDVTWPAHISFVTRMMMQEAERKATGDSSSIRIIRIKRLQGRRAEIELIKTLISCCPVLDKIFLESVVDIRMDIELKMAVELMRAPRASTKAEIIYSKSSGFGPIYGLVNDWE